ncbi:MAG: rod-binding protein [Blastomonas sp.]
MTGPVSSTGPLAGAAAPATGMSQADKARLRDTAEAFEAVFLRQMISTMRTATPGDTLFDSSASDQFRDLQDARLADNMAKQNRFGIAEMLLKQFGVEE